MNKKIVISLPIMMAAMATLTGCASLTGGFNGNKHLKNQMSYQQHQDKQINHKLASVANSVNKSLNKLMSVERGNAVSNFKNHDSIHTSIAASRNNFKKTKSKQPVIKDARKVKKKQEEAKKQAEKEKAIQQANKNNSNYKSYQNYNKQMALNDLKSPVKITWNGSAQSLMKNLAQKINFDFHIKNHNQSNSHNQQQKQHNLHVKVSTPKKGEPVVKVLKDVSNQINNQANIYVNLQNRIIILKYKK